MASIYDPARIARASLAELRKLAPRVLPLAAEVDPGAGAELILAYRVAMLAVDEPDRPDLDEALALAALSEVAARITAAALLIDCDPDIGRATQLALFAAIANEFTRARANIRLRQAAAAELRPPAARH